MQLDERGPGFEAVLEPVLLEPTATVKCVTTLAARGWPVGCGRGILHSLIEDTLHVHAITPGGALFTELRSSELRFEIVGIEIVGIEIVGIDIVGIEIVGIAIV